MAEPGGSRSSTEIDRKVGRRICERRVMLGLTQQQLGEMLGFSYQRVHKYECGVSRVSAGVLYQIAYMLNAPIGYFFNETGEQEQAGEQPLRPAESFPRGRREIARNFSNIRNKKHQEAFSHLVRALAGR